MEVETAETLVVSDDDDDDIMMFQRSTSTVDASPWLLIGTTVFCFAIMILVVPFLVSLERRRRRRLKRQTIPKEKEDFDDQQQRQQQQQEQSSSSSTSTSPISLSLLLQSIVTWDDETRSIFDLVIPYTVSGVSGELFSNCILIIVGQCIGTKQLAAYALVHMLLDLTNGIFMGPIYATITLSSHALGANNNLLVGQYIQLAIGTYLTLSIPFLYYWYYFMHPTILWLHWGDDETAMLAQHFTQYVVWSILLNGITQSITILWSITDHPFAKSFLEVTRNASNVVVLGLLLLVVYNNNDNDSNVTPSELEEEYNDDTTTTTMTLQVVGLIHSMISLTFLVIAVVVSVYKGWLEPFQSGLFGGLAFVDNFSAFQLLITTSIPLSGGELLMHAEWSILTVLASFIGPAEVAAWAILGNIWDLFYYISEGVGEAAEIRISLHLGDNHPALAKLSTYKSLMIGSISAICVSVLFFALQDIIPTWFTSDATLQELLRELVPFVGVANLTMMFGMNCWYVLGAQGKYGLATWITSLSSWTICIPLSAFFVMVCHFDLQGLASALSIGYVTSGACLSYFTMITDWSAVAKKISTENAEEEEDSSPANEMHQEEKMDATEKSPLLSNGHSTV